MHKTFKTKIYLNKGQLYTVRRTLGCCRYVRNMYIEKVIEYYKETGKFLGAYEFSKRLNNQKKHDESIMFLQGISSKALREAIIREEQVFKQYFKKKRNNEKCHYPRFISRKNIRHESYYFIKDNIHLNTNNTNIIKLPILGKVRISESLDHFPEEYKIISGRIIRENNNFYLMFIYTDEPDIIDTNNYGIGIDVGIENYATIAFNEDIDSIVIPNFVKSDVYKQKEERYNKILKAISHKVEINYGKLLNKYLDKHHGEEPDEITKNIMKGESYKSTRIQKLRNKSRKAYKDIVNYRNNEINRMVKFITARLKPSYITIENLSIQNMLQHFPENMPKEKSNELHKYISNSSFYLFKMKLIYKCMNYGIELRLANKYFASSKICCRCGNKKKDLSLSDRIYKCNVCGNTLSRDLNASINLVLLDKYDIIA